MWLSVGKSFLLALLNKQFWVTDDSIVNPNKNGNIKTHLKFLLKTVH